MNVAEGRMFGGRDVYPDQTMPQILRDPGVEIIRVRVWSTRKPSRIGKSRKCQRKMSHHHSLAADLIKLMIHRFSNPLHALNRGQAPGEAIGRSITHLTWIDRLALGP